VDPIPSQIRQLFASAIRSLDAGERCLLVVDNLETVADAEQAVRYLAELAGRHKVLLTSRETVSGAPFVVGEQRIAALSDAAARQFGEYLGRQGWLDLTGTDLDELVRATEGNPLLIR
jgi:hypothetical protein